MNSVLHSHAGNTSHLVFFFFLPVGEQLRLGPWGWGQVDWQVPTARVRDCNTYNHMLQEDHMVVVVVSASCCLVHRTDNMLWTDSSGGADQKCRNEIKIYTHIQGYLQEHWVKTILSQCCEVGKNNNHRSRFPSSKSHRPLLRSPKSQQASATKSEKTKLTDIVYFFAEKIKTDQQQINVWTM